MKNVSTAVLVCFLAAPAAFGQDTTCAARAKRPAIGASLNYSATDNNMTTEVVPHRFDEDAHVGLGPGASVSALIPVGGGSGIVAKIGRAGLGVDRRTFKAFNGSKPIESVYLGRLGVSQVSVGLVRHSRIGSRVCGYAAGMVGVFRFAYEGYRSRVPGISGTLGVERPFSKSGGTFFEVELDAAGNGSKPPLNAYLAVVGKASFGLRRRF